MIKLGKEGGERDLDTHFPCSLNSLAKVEVHYFIIWKTFLYLLCKNIAVNVSELLVTLFIVKNFLKRISAVKKIKKILDNHLTPYFN